VIRKKIRAVPYGENETNAYLVFRSSRAAKEQSASEPLKCDFAD
jgi:hypothetical protein